MFGKWIKSSIKVIFIICRPILLHTQHGNYIAEKGSGKNHLNYSHWFFFVLVYIKKNYIYLEKDLADPVQITKDVERSLYYYPQGKTKKKY